MPQGRLYVCPTPIGNLEDITIRTLKTLREVDFIAAEDTRRASKVLHRYRIRKSLISYYAHNEKIRAAELLQKIQQGADLALISDAGMPGISDPGFEIIRACIDNHIHVEVLPGPSVVINALVASGLPTNRFIYLGFFPRKKNERESLIARLSVLEETAIMFERASRLPKLIADISKLSPDRRLVIARELTKFHEQIVRSTVSEAPSKITEMPLKGEVVVLLEGSSGRDEALEQIGSINERFEYFTASGVSKSDAIKFIAKETGWSRRKLYNGLIKTEKIKK